MGRKHAQIMDYQWMEINPKRERLVRKHFCWLMPETHSLWDEWFSVELLNVHSNAGVVRNWLYPLQNWEGSDAVLGENECLMNKWIPRGHKKNFLIYTTSMHEGTLRLMLWMVSFFACICILGVVSRHTNTYWSNVISLSPGNVRAFMIIIFFYWA